MSETAASENEKKEPTGQQKLLTKRLYGMAFDVVRTMLLQAERFAILEETPGGFKAILSKELGGDISSELSTQMLRMTLQNEQSLMVLDAMRESAYSSSEVVQEKQIRSVLCVPFETPNGRALIYVDSLSQGNCFSVKEKKELEGVAQRLARNLEIIASAKPESESVSLIPEQGSQTTPYTTLRNGIVAMVLLMVLMVIGSVVNHGWTVEPVEEQPVAKADNPPDLAVRPFGLTRDFMSHLLEERSDQAKQMLDERLAQQVTSGDLKKLGEELRANQQAQTNFQVLSEEVSGRRATVVVGRTLQGSPDDLWTLQFARQRGVWKLKSAKGKSFNQNTWEDRSKNGYPAGG